MFLYCMCILHESDVLRLFSRPRIKQVFADPFKNQNIISCDVDFAFFFLKKTLDLGSLGDNWKVIFIRPYQGG